MAAVDEAPAPPLRLTLAAVGAELEDRIALYRAELETLTQARADRDAAEFLLELARVIPAGVVFSAADLRRHATLDRALAARLGRTSTRRLGRRLAAIAGRSVVPRIIPADRASSAGIIRVVLECLGRANDGCMWQLRITP